MNRMIKGKTFLVVLLLSLVVNTGCDGVDVGIAEVLDIFTRTTSSESETELEGESESDPVTNPNADDNREEEIVMKENKPVLEHGYLSLNGTQIVDEYGKPFQLKGVSTHGIQWFPDYVSKDTFRTMRDDWHINIVRLAMYTDPNVGYDKSLHEVVDKGVKYAIDLDLYVIIDWHILSDGNPNASKDRAIQFFDTMSKKYKDVPNVLYEICNEPNGNVTWEQDIKPYATSVIDVIRKNDNKGLIIVGTPTWSQDVDVVAKDPIENEENILYSLHFYAASHKEGLRNKLNEALELELPIIVSEFGISEASGNGEINEKQGDFWLDLLEEYDIGYVAWDLSNKDESSALIRPDVERTSDWDYSDLTKWGQWFVDRIK